MDRRHYGIKWTTIARLLNGIRFSRGSASAGTPRPTRRCELSSEMATPSIFVVSRPKQPEHATPDGAVIENA